MTDTNWVWLCDVERNCFTFCNNLHLISLFFLLHFSIFVSETLLITDIFADEPTFRFYRVGKTYRITIDSRYFLTFRLQEPRPDMMAQQLFGCTYVCYGLTLCYNRPILILLAWNCKCLHQFYIDIIYKPARQLLSTSVALIANQVIIIAMISPLALRFSLLFWIIWRKYSKFDFDSK